MIYRLALRHQKLESVAVDNRIDTAGAVSIDFSGNSPWPLIAAAVTTIGDLANRRVQQETTATNRGAA